MQKFEWEGFLVVNKPKGLTSHDVVDKVRRIFGLKKVGHTGTLDPLATGVLVLCLGRATRLSRFLLVDPKEYIAEMVLGVRTDTLDATGKVISSSPCHASEKTVKEVISTFKGPLIQIPPMTSAIKVGGKPLYRLARKGIEIERKPRQVLIYESELLDFENGDYPKVKFRIITSKGTYIRVFCSDIGEKLGCGAHLSELKRMRAGKFSLDEAFTLEDLKELKAKGQLGEAIISINSGLDNYPFIMLQEGAEARVRNGSPIFPKMIKNSEPLQEGGIVRVIDASGNFIAMACCSKRLTFERRKPLANLLCVLS